jgi:type IV pilus assembly protein PilM
LYLDQAAKLTEVAQRLVEQRAYDEAAAELEKIPPPMRDHMALDLLARVQDTLREIAALRETIRQPKGTAFRERMRAIERLLILQPHDQQVSRWAQQAREHIRQSAERKLQGHQYRSAVELLQAVPSPVVDQAITRFLQRATELEYLDTELQLAPEITEDTLRIAQRLVQLDSDNQDAQRVLETMTRQYQEKRKTRGAAFPEWTPCPADPLVGLPVHSYTTARRLACENADAGRVWREHPGQFFVACGLALQALDRAAVTTSLLPRRDEGLLGKIRLAPRKPALRSAWGLDVGGGGVKAVRLEVADDERIRVAQCLYVPHRKPLTHPEVAPVKQADLLETLQSLASRTTVAESERVATQWPLVQSLVRFLQLPPAAGKKLARVVTHETRRQIPFPLEEVCWDTFTFADDTADDAPELQSTLLLAARKRDVEEHLGLFRRAGIEVHVLQCDAVGLHNSCHYDLLTMPNNSSAGPPAAGVVLLDVGTELTRVVFSFPRMLWFRSIPFGQDELVNGLTQRFALTRDVAEQVLRNPTKAKRMSDVHQACCSVFQKMVGHYESSLAEFRKSSPGVALREMLVVGDAGRAPGLLRYLRYGR